MNVGALSTGSKVALLVVVQAGSAIMMSIAPSVVRMYYLRKHIPADMRVYDLKKFERIPQWLVEYKSLQFLLRFVIGYQIVWYTFGIVGLWICASSSDGVNQDPSSSNLGYVRDTWCQCLR